MLENDPVDRETTLIILNEKFPGVDVNFLSYSNEVMIYLMDKVLSGKSLPHLVLLSMNSIPDNGLTVLKEVRNIPSLRHLPVIILGENTLPSMIKACYDAGANTFISKPMSNESTHYKIGTFMNYWFEVAETLDETSMKSSLIH
jgi:response regulator RpfG family c-di-GMP phosphodiesterase